MTPEQRALNEWIWKHDPIEPQIKPNRADPVGAWIVVGCIICLLTVIGRFIW